MQSNSNSNNNNNSRRWSPFMRQSAVGLTILVSLGLLGGLIAWLTNFTFGGRSFRATFLFPNAGGMTVGTRIAYRGVRIGQIISVTPEPEGVALEVEIRPANRLIPANSLIEATQAGLVGETTIDIIPLEPLPPEGVKAKPLDRNCDPQIIICNGSRLQGEGKLDVNTLIRSLVRIANIISEPALSSAVRTLFQKSSDALGQFSSLSQNANLFLEDVRKTNTVGNLNSTLSSINNFSDQAGTLLTEAESQDTIKQLNKTLKSLGGAAEKVQVFIAMNQDDIANTVADVGQVSQDLSTSLKSLDPILVKLDTGEFLDNLDTIADNASDLTANLRDFSAQLNDPNTVIQIQKILDSARSVFENLNKVTSDVDELTGDPELRRQMIRLIQGLSNLVSSTQQLQQQVQYAQILNEVAMEINRPQSSNSTPLSTTKSTSKTTKP